MFPDKSIAVKTYLLIRQLNPLFSFTVFVSLHLCCKHSASYNCIRIMASTLAQWRDSKLIFGFTVCLEGSGEILPSLSLEVENVLRTIVFVHGSQLLSFLIVFCYPLNFYQSPSVSSLAMGE